MIKYWIRTDQNPDFEGIDVSHEISLFEYGLLVRKTPDKNGDHSVIYGINVDNDGNYIGFGQVWTNEKEIDAYILGDEFPSEGDIIGFLDSIGMEKENWLKLPIEIKIYDLLNYWGHENIFGTCYNPWGIKTVLKIYGKEVENEN